MTDSTTVFDVAVSFSGYQRDKVVPVVRACEQRGLKVFLDEDHAVDLWGRNLIEAMREIYGGNRARYFVPFISQEYLTGPYPMDEFRTAQTHAIGVFEDTYILPIRMGEVDIPPTLLNKANMYLQFEHYDVAGLADAIARRVGQPPQHQRQVQP